MFKLIKSLFYKIYKSRFIKELLKVDTPEDYIEKYNAFKDYYSKYKEGKYDKEVIEEMLGAYLKSKGLKKIEEVMRELDIKNKILEDSNIINKLIERIDKLETNTNDLQELVLAVLQENKHLKEKFNTLNMLNWKKTTGKNRNKFSVK